MLTYKELELLVLEAKETIRSTSDLALARRYKAYIKALDAEITKRKAKNARAKRTQPMARQA
jgi:hypothetical protein